MNDEKFGEIILAKAFMKQYGMSKGKNKNKTPNQQGSHCGWRGE